MQPSWRVEPAALSCVVKLTRVAPCVFWCSLHLWGLPWEKGWSVLCTQASGAGFMLSSCLLLLLPEDPGGCLGLWPVVLWTLFLECCLRFLRFFCCLEYPWPAPYLFPASTLRKQRTLSFLGVNSEGSMRSVLSE